MSSASCAVILLTDEPAPALNHAAENHGFEWGAAKLRELDIVHAPVIIADCTALAWNEVEFRLLRPRFR